MIIALIEDDEAALHSLTLLLQQQGMATRSFDSVEAFLAAQDLIPACIVSDVRLPGRTGLDLQRELKRQRRSIPYIGSNPAVGTVMDWAAVCLSAVSQSSHASVRSCDRHIGQ